MAVTPETVVGWDHPGTDVLGEPETILEAQLALTYPGDSIDGVFSPLATIDVVCPGAGQVTLAGLLLGQASGEYDLCCRVIDDAGNWSVWSSPLSIVYESPGCPEVDTDGDGVLDCDDRCPEDPDKVDPGACGCGTPDVDDDGNGLADCVEGLPFIRGDANRDSRLDIGDSIRTLNFLFGREPVACRVACDANDDNRVDIADAIWLLNFLFLGHEPPPHPYPGAGHDSETPGPLRCEG